VHESLILSLPPPTFIARTIEILLHVYCALYDAPPTPLVYDMHYTILVIAISCKGPATMLLYQHWWRKSIENFFFANWLPSTRWACSLTLSKCTSTRFSKRQSPSGRPHRLGLPMVVCVECLPADKPWDVVSATRRSSGVAPRDCVRVYARVLVPPNPNIHTYMVTIRANPASTFFFGTTRCFTSAGGASLSRTSFVFWLRAIPSGQLFGLTRRPPLSQAQRSALPPLVAKVCGEPVRELG